MSAEVADGVTEGILELVASGDMEAAGTSPEGETMWRLTPKGLKRAAALVKRMDPIESERLKAAVKATVLKR